jgi:hypothetical protein
VGKLDVMAPLGKPSLTREDGIKMAHIKGVRGWGMDSWERRSGAGSCEHSNEPWGSINCGEFRG